MKLMTIVCAFVLIAGTTPSGQQLQAIAPIKDYTPEQPLNPLYESIPLVEPLAQVNYTKIKTVEKKIIPKPKPKPKPKVQAERRQPVVQRARTYIAGNGYAAGNCTYYGKSRRPDLPNNLGNANQWLYNAQARGIPTGNQPRAGAIGVTSRGYYGHVIYVESVNGDGTINISDMNYRNLYEVTYRTVNASNFSYIY